MFAPETSLSSCPEGFELVRDGECRGFYSTVYTSGNQELDIAVTKCSEIDGRPAIIHDDEASLVRCKPNDKNFFSINPT